jgi:selenocysteine lyase/cysteine desulfurase
MGVSRCRHSAPSSARAQTTTAEADAAGEPAAALASRLRSRDANVSVTVRAAAPKDPHLRLLDGAVRASVHYYNTSDEIARFAELVAAG